MQIGYKQGNVAPELFKQATITLLAETASIW